MNIGLEPAAWCAYSLPMDDPTRRDPPPAGWLEALARSEAQLAAGQVVPGEAILRELRESIARLEAKHAAQPPRRTLPRR